MNASLPPLQKPSDTASGKGVKVRGNRPCVLCGAHVPRAAFILESGPVCKSCAQRFYKPGTCEICGKGSSSLGRSPSQGIFVKACRTCRSKGFINCAECGKHRPPHGQRESDGKPLCKRCFERKGKKWICPTCKQPGVYHSRIKCQDCYWRGNLAERVRKTQRAIKHAWLRAAFEGFHRELAARLSPRISAVRVDTYVPLVLKLDVLFSSPKDVSVAKLMTAFGMPQLRYYASFFDYCHHARIIPNVTAASLRESSVENRIALLIADCDDKWFADLVKDLYQTLIKVQSRAISRGHDDAKHMRPRTVLALVNTTIRFFECAHEAGAQSLLEITQEHVDTFLLEFPGYRASLGSALTRLRRNHKILRRTRIPSIDSRITTNLLIPRGRINELLRECVAAEGEDASHALILALLLTFPISPGALTRLRTKDVVIGEDGRYRFTIAELPIICPLWASELFDHHLAYRRASNPLDSPGENPWLFTGRNAGEHLQATSVAYHLKQHGLTSRQTFASAMLSLYMDGLKHPSIAMRTFGVSVETAMKYFAFYDEFTRSATYRKFAALRSNSQDDARGPSA